MSKSTRVVFLLLLLESCGHRNTSENKPRKDAPVVVDVIIAQPKKISNTIEANGTVVANESVQLHPEVSGRITFLFVPEGKYIAKGTVIARIYDADIRAQIAKSRVQLDLAEKTVDRYRKLLDVQGMNQSDYDAAVNQRDGYRADIQYNEALLDKTVIRAPFSGIVGLRQVSLGAYISNADIVASIQQLNKIKIDFTMPEEYNNVIKIGSAVDVEVDASQETKQKAVIIAVEPQVNQSSRNITVRAVLQQGKANPGAFVKVYINAGEHAKAIMIPTNAIIPDDRNNQVVLVKSGKAAFVNVQTGVREASNVEITKGVREGDTVVVTGVLFARAKAPLQIRNVKTLDQLKGSQQAE